MAAKDFFFEGAVAAFGLQQHVHLSFEAEGVES
jgi:hypothetical protein